MKSINEEKKRKEIATVILLIIVTFVHRKPMWIHEEEQRGHVHCGNIYLQEATNIIVTTISRTTNLNEENVFIHMCCEYTRKKGLIWNIFSFLQTSELLQKLDFNKG